MAGGSGPLTFGADPAVDVPTAKELIDDVHRRVTREELLEIHAELERKAELFAARLGEDAIGELDAEALTAALRATFVARRRAGAVLAARSDAELREWVGALLYGSAPLAERVDAFCGQLDLGPYAAAELAGELLHFTHPERYWLWSRWTWNPDTRTGSLPLVVTEDFDLEDADGIGSTYERVGIAMAAVDASPEAASFRPAGAAAAGGRLATDLFLVSVYGVYMNTVLSLKMTQEFNQIVPPLPQLARRLLGTHAMEV